MTIFEIVFFAILAVVEVYYWFVYFPRAWRDGSNREINDIRAAVLLLKSGAE